MRSPVFTRLRPARVRMPAAGLISLIGALLAAAPAHATEPAAIQVPTLTVEASRDAASLSLDGTLEPQRQAVLAAQAAGSVQQLTVRAGDRVRAGQVIARIDARSAEAGVAQSEAGVVQADANLRNARTQLERTRELRAQGYISQAALDAAENQFRAAEAGLAQARAGRRQATLGQDFTSIAAPFDGVVLATHIDAGDLAAPGRPVLTLYAPGALRATVQVPASQAAPARAARQVEIELPDGRRIAPVRRTELPGADPVAQTVEWRLDLAPGDAADLRPGRTVRVHFTGADLAPTGARSVPTVPAAALLRRGELTAVYVVRENGFVLRQVRAGASHGGSTEVLAGLKTGERIAADAVRAGLAGARP